MLQTALALANWPTLARVWPKDHVIYRTCNEIIMIKLSRRFGPRFCFLRLLLMTLHPCGFIINPASIIGPDFLF